MRSSTETANSPSPTGHPARLLMLLWLCGACLRLTVLAVPPVVPLLHADLSLSETQIGLLSSLPPLMFALAAVPGALLISRLGTVRALLVGLVVTAAASAARAAIPDAVALFAATAAMAAGISVMQPSLPHLVRAWFPQRIGFATSVYGNGLLVGEIVVAALTIPLLLPWLGNSWRLSFAFWSLPVLATALLVGLWAPHHGGSSPSGAAPVLWWPDWKGPLVWRLGILFGMVNAMYFATNGFLPDYLTAQGRPDLIGSALTALNLSQLPASFLMLAFAGRLAQRPSAYVATAAVSLAGLVGMMAMKGTWIVFWSGVLGFANATTLILALALPSLLSAPQDVHRTSAGMFTISYSCAMITAIICGYAWDMTGQPVAGLAPIAICAVIATMLAPTIGVQVRPAIEPA